MPVGPEAKIQIAIIKWLRLVMPKCLVVHVKNEHGKRGRAGMIAAQQAKSAGIVPGFPDLICFPYSNVGVFCLEVKAPKGRVSEAQKQVHDMLEARGYPVAVVRSIDDTRDFLRAQNIGFREVQFE